MIEFHSEQLVARFLKPGTEEVVEAVSEVRRDPLTGRTMRITAPRPVPAGIHRAPPDIPEKQLHRERCPFCRDLASVAPGLDPAWSAEHQMRCGEAVLFPNLFPYGAFSAVIVLTKEHHVPINQFTREQLRDGLIVAREYVRQVVAAHPEARYVNVTWNLLPPSGGTLVHPHFQVNLDPVPVNSLRETQASSLRFRAAHGCSYWDALVEREREVRQRFVADVGATAWMVPFAPRRHLEMWGVVPQRSSVVSLLDAELENLAEGLHNVLAAYSRIGSNALNMAIETDEGPEDEPAVRMRVAVRSTWRPWYRSDQTHFDVMLEECATIIAPEAAAAALFRPAFGVTAGVSDSLFA